MFNEAAFHNKAVDQFSLLGGGAGDGNRGNTKVAGFLHEADGAAAACSCDEKC